MRITAGIGAPAEVDAFMREIQQATNKPTSGMEFMARILENPKRVPLLLGAIEREPESMWAGLLVSYCFAAEHMDVRRLPPDKRLELFVQASEYLSAASKTMSKALEASPGHAGLQASLLALDEALVEALFESKTRSREAGPIAQRVLDSASPTNWNYGNVVYSMHSFLGRLALQEGDTNAAKRHLKQAAATLEPVQPRSFYPQFELARDLLAKGERDAVLEHLDQVARFWANPERETNQAARLSVTENRQSIDLWKEQIQHGRMPTGSRWPTPMDTDQAQSFRLGGKLVDKSGKPVPGATVTAYFDGRDPVPKVEGRSDANGLFDLSVPLSGGLLVASEDGYAFVWTRWMSVSIGHIGSGPQLMMLSPPFEVGGLVTDEAGTPVADAEVWIKAAVLERKRPYSSPEYAVLNEKPARDCFSTRSGPDGRFHIGRLPAEAGVLLVARKGEKVSSRFNEMPTINQMPNYAGQKDIKLTLALPRTPGSRSGRSQDTGRQRNTLLAVTGIVRDGSGAVLEGVKLVTCPPLNGPVYNPTAQTDTNGSYSLTITVDSLRSAKTYSPSVRLLARDLARNLAAAKELADAVTNLDFTLQPAIEIVGRVEEPGGRAVPTARLRLSIFSSNRMAQSYLSETTVADSEGHFRIRGLPSDLTYGITASATDHGSQSREIPSVGSPIKPVELKPFVLKLANSILAGQLIDPDGQPVAGTFVSMYGDGQESASVRTDADGQFRFGSVCEGEVYVTASHQNLSAVAKTKAGETNVMLKLQSRNRPLPSERK